MRVVVSVAILLLCATAVLGRASWPWRSVSEEDAEKNVKFELYSRNHIEDPEIVTASELPAALEYFDAARPTKVLVHGWRGSKAHSTSLMKAFLQTSELNVFVVNWRDVDTYYYPGAVKRVKTVARQVAALVDFLVETHGLRAADLHLVGHSLGAHIAGLSSLYLTNTTIGRVTGLDPAGPLFKDGRENRLDKSHAAFVDVVHTCGNVFGYHDPVGHVDFYPNGGLCFQPGCLYKDMTTGKCSHNRAYELFRESILLGDSFMAHPASAARADTSDSALCSAMDTETEAVPMGLPTPSSARGVYCLATRSSEPFGYGQEVAALLSDVPSALQTRFMKYVFMRE